MSAPGPTTATNTDAVTLGEADPTIAALDDVYLDSTLVLVGCGKAKRDPEDPTDLHLASTPPGERIRQHGPEGPAWEAQDLYTSSYFAVKREFAETVTQWTGTPERGWSILSAEHHVVYPFEQLPYYDTRIDDLGDDPSNPDHHVEFPYRQPTGAPVVTELDKWASMVAISLSKWVADFRDGGAHPTECNANTLLVLAGKDYVEPLRDRDVFTNGAGRVMGDPNQFFELPVDVRFLFEEIEQDGMFDQMAWLSDAVDRRDTGDTEPTAQAEVGTWTDDERACSRCGIAAADDDTLREYGGEVNAVCCGDCAPRSCARCGDATHETGLGSYPLCAGCQTERGGQKRETIDAVDHEQAALDGGRVDD
mgnify:CR=1 FL=1